MTYMAIFLGTLIVALSAIAQRADAGEPQVAHMVYFELKDASPEKQKHLVAACNKYLSQHEGTVYYSAGTLAEDLDRDVNVRDFHVALHLVFKDGAAQAKYQNHPLHKQFIAENKDNWKSVRVFDSYVTPSDK